MTNNKNELIRVNVILNKDDSGYEQELSARIDPAQLEALGYIKKEKADEKINQIINGIIVIFKVCADSELREEVGKYITQLKAKSTP